jgi:hypothetical protein
MCAIVYVAVVSSKAAINLNKEIIVKLDGIITTNEEKKQTDEQNV